MKDKGLLMEKSCLTGKIMTFLLAAASALLMGLAVQAAPVITGVTLDKSSMTAGTDTLRIQVDASCPESVKCVVGIRNAAGKNVYTKTVGRGTGPSFITTWDGKASASNKAGVAAGSYAPAGSYKVRVALSYKENGKTKYVRSSVSLKVKAAGASGTGASGSDDAATGVEREAYVPAPKVTSQVAPVLGSKSWDWVVQVTGNKKVDYLAEVICQEILDPGMSEYSRCKKIYAWCVMHFTREGGAVKASTTPYKIDVSSAQAKANMSAYRKQVKAMIKEGTAVVNTSDSQTPNGVYQGWYYKRMQGLGKQVGDCTQAAAMFECLCRHAGLECDIIENSLPNTNPQHHFWNVTRIDGRWYYNDARMENARLYGRTTVRYTMFLRGKVSLAKKEARYGMIKEKYAKLYARCEINDYGK